MFDRFTDDARQTIVLAQAEAARFRHVEINNEHLLLGMLAQQDCMAVKVLGVLNVEPDAVRDQIEQGIELGESDACGKNPFADRLRRMLDLGLREALQLGHGYIGTEHLLLGIMRQNEGVAADALMDHGANLNQARAAVVRALQGYTTPA